MASLLQVEFIFLVRLTSSQKVKPKLECIVIRFEFTICARVFYKSRHRRIAVARVCHGRRLVLLLSRGKN